jgi:hypothetical protein
MLKKLFFFLKPYIGIFWSSASAALIQIAREVVAEIAAEFDGAPGATKRSNAYERIATRLRNRGIYIGAQAINAAIESAVAERKAGK